MPDIIQCHQGISLDLTLEASSRVNPDLPPTNNADIETMESDDWAVEVKLLVRPSWRQTGIELRAIADELEVRSLVNFLLYFPLYHLGDTLIIRLIYSKIIDYSHNMQEKVTQKKEKRKF